jgi:hypothetical protein
MSAAMWRAPFPKTPIRLRADDLGVHLIKCYAKLNVMPKHTRGRAQRRREVRANASSRPPFDVI